VEGDSRLLDKGAKYERLVSNQSIGIKKPKIPGDSRPGFCRDRLAHILPHKILPGTGPPCGFWRTVIACESGANLTRALHDEQQTLNMVFFMVSTLMTTVKPASLLAFNGLFTIEWE